MIIHVEGYKRKKKGGSRKCVMVAGYDKIIKKQARS